jgi:hypothetical protein
MSCETLLGNVLRTPPTNEGAREGASAGQPMANQASQAAHICSVLSAKGTIGLASRSQLLSDGHFTKPASVPLSGRVMHSTHSCLLRGHAPRRTVEQTPQRSTSAAYKGPPRSCPRQVVRCTPSSSRGVPHSMWLRQAGVPHSVRRREAGVPRSVWLRLAELLGPLGPRHNRGDDAGAKGALLQRLHPRDGRAPRAAHLIL